MTSRHHCKTGLCPVLRAALALGTACAALLAAPRAQACGGFFCSAPGGPFGPLPVAQTGENVLFAVEEDTARGTSHLEAHIQIFYTGPADKFSWVLPVDGLPTLDVGSNQIFQVLDNGTSPTFSITWHQEGECLAPPPQRGVDAGASFSNSAGASGQATGGVQVAFRGEVGPYEAAVLKADDPAALKTWLDDNKFFISDAAGRLIDDYVADRKFFVALRLQSSKDIREIQPIVLRFDGPGPCVPLKLTSIAALNDLQVKLWVLGRARVVPTNFFELEVNPARINWFSAGSNYDELLKVAANEAGGNAFITEYSGSTSPFRGRFSFAGFDAAAISRAPDPASAVNTIIQQSIPRDGTLLAILRKHIPEPASLVKSGISETTFYNQIGQYWIQLPREFAPFDAGALAADIDKRILIPLRNVETLVLTHAKVTRLRTFISPDEMTSDPTFAFNGSLPDVSNLHTADAYRMCGKRQFTACAAPIRLQLPDGGVQYFWSPAQKATDCFYPTQQPDKSAEAAAGPALAIAYLRTDVGEGEKKVDNRAAINAIQARQPAPRLWGSPDPGTRTPVSGGSAPDGGASTPTSRSNGCALAPASETAAQGTPWLLLAVMLWLRRRRS